MMTGSELVSLLIFSKQALIYAEIIELAELAVFVSIHLVNEYRM